MRLCLSLVAGLLALSFPTRAAERLRVLTTIPPVYCFTANIAGPFAHVQNLLPPGTTAHDFQFTFADRRKLEQTDLLILNGLGLESWLDKTLATAPAKRVARCAEGLASGTNHSNPHLWLDPILACQMVTNILTALQQADPGHAADYATNAAAFVLRLRLLDEEIRSGLLSLTNRAIVTSHDAFAHFAQRYGFTIAGVIEETAEVDPSPAHLTALRAAIQKQRVKALFVDTHTSPRRARQWARDFKIAGGVLDTLEEAPLQPSAYEDAMRRNLRALQQTLR